MKTTLPILLFLTLPLGGQTAGLVDTVKIVTVHSQNGRFHLVSIPFSNEVPTTRGITRVYAGGAATPLYQLDRGFDSVDKDSNNLIISDDGETIFYVRPWEADEETEGLNSVTIYRHGRIHRSYTESEVTGCNKTRERCELLYSSLNEVLDPEKSHFGTPDYTKVFKDGVSEKERFLENFALFGSGDTVYLTDSNMRTHVFDLKEGMLARSDSFENLYGSMKDQGRFTNVELQRYKMEWFIKYPRLKGRGEAREELASQIGMTEYDPARSSDREYRRYDVTVLSTLLRDGRIEIEEITVDEGLPKEKIVEFFKESRFDSSMIPAVFDRWYLGEQHFQFRKSDARLARSERQAQLAEERRERERRLTASTIGGIYIPANLGEAFAELDKLLTPIDREEMRDKSARDNVLPYHMTLGMWMRNNWGLWGGSRLQKYFTDRGVSHPDSMSGVILALYYDWLNGRREAWKEWERNPALKLN